MTDDEPDERQPMEHRDFTIGREFETATGTWRCTDVGTRTVVAIKVSDHQDDPSWFNGPPYAVAEVVFDEYDLDGCWPVGLRDGRDAEEGGRATTPPPKATRSDLLASAHETASDLHAAGVMKARTLDRLLAATEEAPGGDSTTALLYVDGLAAPAARLRLTPEGVEFTFLAERRAGFLAWLASDAAGHVHRLMRQHEREAVVEHMIETWPDEERATGEFDPQREKDL